MIEVNSLTKIFANQAAIHDLSFQAFPGEVIGLFGPPKSGLSTLLRLFSGYLTPSSGSLLIDDRSPTRDKAYFIRVSASIPETLHLPPALKVSALFKLTAELRHLKQPKKAIEGLVEKLDLSLCLHEPMGCLPPSWQKLVAVAQAFLHDPHLLYLDDPFESGDSWQKQRLRSWLKMMPEHGITILSSHHLDDLLSACDRILFLYKGRLILDRPSNRFLHDFDVKRTLGDFGLEVPT